MKHFGFRCVKEQVLLDISVSPLWCWLLLRAADGLCALTSHRLCNSLVLWTYGIEEKRVRAHLAIPVGRETWIEWAKATGAEDPSWWWTEDE